MILLVTALHDTAAALGLVHTGPLINAGFVAFVLAASTTLATRYATVASDLDDRSAELRTRIRELRRAHSDLLDARQELSQKEQLAVVGELAAVIAHEVRNPLAIIANAVASLRKQATSREDRETLLSILEEETNRLNRLVRDLLRYARPVSLQRTQFALHDLIERAIGFLRARTGIAVDFVVECQDTSAECKLWGDANLLRQVFDNLIDNAIQAMGTGGTLTVRVRPTLFEGARGLAVDIIDTGEGMDTQVRSRARDPFFTTRPSGTGLGLAIVDRIVEAHGGRFLIESSSGEGTTATVFLPYVPSRDEGLELSTG
jgi:signal transduction histidine kinase